MTEVQRLGFKKNQNLPQSVLNGKESFGSFIFVFRGRLLI